MQQNGKHPSQTFAIIKLQHLGLHPSFQRPSSDVEFFDFSFNNEVILQHLDDYSTESNRKILNQ